MAEHTPQRAKSRLETWRKRYALVSDIASPQRLGLLLAVAVLALVGALGGWSAVEEAETDLPVVAVGDPVTAAPFEVTVRRARHLDRIEGVLPTQEGFRYLVVSLDVTVRNDRYVEATDVRTAIALDAPGLKKLNGAGEALPEPPRLLRGVDGLDARSYQPDLTLPTVVVWQQEAATPVPEEVTVTFSKQTWRRSSLDGSWLWADATPVARVTVPVELWEEPR